MTSASPSQRKSLHLVTDAAIEQELEQRDEVLVSIALRLVDQRELGISRVHVHGLVNTTTVVRDSDEIASPGSAHILCPSLRAKPSPVGASPGRNLWAELTLWCRLLRVGVGFHTRHQYDE